jgi:protein phosphatase
MKGYNQNFMLEAFGATDPGCVRTNNEDAFIVAPELGLYLVADGMGGAAAGETASHIAAETMREILEDLGAEDMNTAKMVTACHEVNRRIKAAAAKDSRLEGMGTTLVAGVEVGGKLLLASVGDSRAYRFENGTLTPITEDQSWVNDIGRKLGLPEDMLKTHPMRHVLTMALGVSQELRVNSYTQAMVPGTLVLICSDGLHGPVSSGEIAAVLAESTTLEQRVRKLIDTARAHGAPDNVTAVLLRAA